MSRFSRGRGVQLDQPVAVDQLPGAAVPDGAQIIHLLGQGLGMVATGLLILRPMHAGLRVTSPPPPPGAKRQIIRATSGIRIILSKAMLPLLGLVISVMVFQNMLEAVRAAAYFVALKLAMG